MRRIWWVLFIALIAMPCYGQGSINMPSDTDAAVSEAYHVDTNYVKHQAYEGAMMCILEHGGTLLSPITPFDKIVWWQVDESYFVVSTYNSKIKPLFLIGYAYRKSITIAQWQTDMPMFLLFEHEIAHILAGDTSHVSSFWKDCHWM